MSILFTPTHPCTMPTLPPCLFLKWAPFAMASTSTPITITDNSSSVEALMAKYDVLQQEVDSLHVWNKELHQVMEDSRLHEHTDVILGKFCRMHYGVECR